MSNPKEINDFEELENDDHLSKEQIRRAHEDRSKSRRKTTKHRERQTVKEIPAKEAFTGPQTEARIVRAEGAHFIGRLSQGKEIRTKTIKNTKTENHNATLVAVGDVVVVGLPEEGDAVIELVKERRTKLARKASGRRDAFEQVIVSNIDVLVIVVAAAEPPLKTGIIDRYIIAGIDGKLEVCVVINKLDIADELEKEYAEYVIDLYNSLGYTAIGLSTITQEGFEQLKAVLAGKTCVFAGHSGVGKSSMVNVLLGKEFGKTAALSKKYKRGAHTTTGSVLIPLDVASNSFIVDTPGVREFSNYEIDPENLKFHFVEFLPLQEHCQITNCTHLHEPGCAVIDALDDEKISVERYTSYMKLYEEAKEVERKKFD